MAKKYYAAVYPVPVAVVQVVRCEGERAWFIGYRISAKDKRYRHYGKIKKFDSEASAQRALDECAKAAMLREVE